MGTTRGELANGLYFLGLLILVTGLPLSMFLMSISQMVLLGSWIISGNVLKKLKSFFTNPVTLILASVFLIHLAGMAWSSDLHYALHDCQIKVPLLILPLVISSSDPLSTEKFQSVLYVFISSVILATLISCAVLLGLTHYKVNDIRDISIFISHIRFGLLICIAVFCLIWFLIKKGIEVKSVHTLIMVSAILWLLVFLVIMEAVTAIVVLIGVSLIAGLFFLFRNPNKIVKAFLIVPVILISSLFIYIWQISGEVSISVSPDFSKMDSLTARGNPYLLTLPYNDTENGHAVWTYVCPVEIYSTWATKSKMDIMGYDKRNQSIYYTLVRYLASKGLRKDADGINSLSETDIKAIEAGYANFRFTETSSLSYRIYQIVWEYHQYIRFHKPEGHSVIQRLVFWETGWRIFKSNSLIGVGTGDVQTAFDTQYTLDKNHLPKPFWLRAHNQYLTFALTFGIGGFLLFIFSLFYPFFKLKKKTDALYSLFLFTALISFFTEDTLETQAGVTFFAFFNSFFLFNPGYSTNGIVKKALGNQ